MQKREREVEIRRVGNRHAQHRRQDDGCVAEYHGEHEPQQHRMQRRVIACTTNGRFFHLQADVERAQNLDGLRHDFRTDAVTRQYCDFHATLPGSVS